MEDVYLVDVDCPRDSRLAGTVDALPSHAVESLAVGLGTGPDRSTTLADRSGSTQTVHIGIKEVIAPARAVAAYRGGRQVAVRKPWSVATSGGERRSADAPR